MITSKIVLYTDVELYWKWKNKSRNSDRNKI